MTARPDDTPYDAGQDAHDCYLEWVAYMREQHLKAPAKQPPLTPVPDVA